MLTFSNCHQVYTYTWINSGEHATRKALRTAFCSGAGAGHRKGCHGGCIQPREGRAGAPDTCWEWAGQPSSVNALPPGSSRFMYERSLPTSFPSDFHCLQFLYFYSPTVLRKRTNISVIYFWIYTYTQICVHISTYILLHLLIYLYKAISFFLFLELAFSIMEKNGKWWIWAMLIWEVQRDVFI